MDFRRSGVLLLLALLVGCSARHQLPIDTGAEASRLEKAVHDEINRVRKQHGLFRLKSDGNLAKIARRHSRDMGQRSYFAHDSPEGQDFLARYRAGGYDCEVPVGNQIYQGGENLFQTHRAGRYIISSDGARTETDLQSISQMAYNVVDGWMHSPLHRENIVRPFWGREGIGVYLAPTGEIYLTQNFC
jgi:uncharacterized protein YkwD